MANTMTLISSVTVGAGGASSISFSSIPSTYTDIVVQYSLRSTTAGLYAGYQNAVFGRFNSSGSSYTNRWLQAEGGSSVNSGTDYFGSGTAYAVFGAADPSDWTSNTFGNGQVYVPNYAGSNNKSFSIDTVAENNASAGSLLFSSGLWSNSSAINSIAITFQTGNIAQYSTAYLYGVKNA
jgi:hypothetical protein